MNIKTDIDFLNQIEHIVAEKQISYYDAILHYIEIYNIEIDVIASLVKNNINLQSKIREDCESLNLVEKTHKLPV
jgi:hypothetical protein